MFSAATTVTGNEKGRTLRECSKTTAMAATANFATAGVIWLCACVRYWSVKSWVGACVSVDPSFLRNLYFGAILWERSKDFRIAYFKSRENVLFLCLYVNLPL